jgi:hypothetical protein
MNDWEPCGIHTHVAVIPRLFMSITTPNVSTSFTLLSTVFYYYTCAVKALKLESPIRVNNRARQSEIILLSNQIASSRVLQWSISLIWGCSYDRWSTLAVTFVLLAVHWLHSKESVISIDFASKCHKLTAQWLHSKTDINTLLALWLNRIIWGQIISLIESFDMSNHQNKDVDSYINIISSFIWYI